MGRLLCIRVIFMMQICESLNILSILDEMSESDYKTNYKASIENALYSRSHSYQVSYNELKCDSYSDIESILTLYSPDLVLDFSQTLLLKTQLFHLSSSYSFIHIMVSPPYLASKPTSFSLVNDYNQHFKALSNTLSHFDWREIILIGTDDDFSVEFLDYLSDFYGISPKYTFILSSSATYQAVEREVSKVLSPLGRKLFLFTCDGKVSTYFLRALNEKKLKGKGYGYLLSYKSSLYDDENGEIFDTGLLGVIEEGMARMKYEEYIKRKIEILLNSIWNICEIKCNYYILHYDLYADYINLQQLKLFNIQNYKEHTVGYYENNTLIISDSIIFPGYITQIPDNAPVTITISIPTDLSNPSGKLNTLSKPIFAGAEVAIRDIDSSDEILPNFKVIQQDYGYGSLEFEYSWSKNKLESYKDSFGVALLSSLRSSGAIGLMEILNELDITKPIIGSTNTAVILNDSSTFPYYVRTVLADDYMPTLYMRMCAYFDWEEISILYIDDVWGIGIYETMLKEAELVGVSFKNKEHLRKIPTTFNETNIPVESIQDVIDSGTRVVILAVIDEEVNMIIEKFYDLGMREGDLLIIAVEWLNMNVITQGEKDSIKKRKELVKGALQFFPRTWIGDLGEKVRNDIKEFSGMEEHYQGCFYYDSTILVALGVDYLTRYGEDYNDPTILINSLRETKFTGCTGYVKINEGSNDRDAMIFSVQNMQYNSTLDQWYLKEVIIYNPYSTQILKFIAQVQWPLDSTTIPKSMRTSNSDCPFEDNDLHDFTKGRYLFFGACYSIVFLAILTTTLLWFNIWNFSIFPLKDRKEITIRDYYTILTLIVEFLQFANLGPDFTNTNDFIAYISQIASSDLVSLIRFRKGVFWICLNVVISVCVLWFTLMMFVLFKLDAKFQRFRIGRIIAKFSEIFLPIGGELLFLPIMNILLNVFECEQAVGDPSNLDYLDSILTKDCYAKCWHSTHIMYVCLSLISFLIYQPFAVMTLPLWSILEENVNIRPQPQFLMVRVILELILVVIYKTLRKVNEVLHAVVFLILISVYIIYLIIYPPFNYARASCWKILSMLCVLWLSLVAVLNDQLCIYCVLSPSIVLILGWVIIIGCGVLFIKRKLPALLFNETKDIRKLMDFGMRRRSQVLASEIAHKLNIVIAQRLERKNLEKFDELDQTPSNVLTGQFPEGLNLTFQQVSSSARERDED